MHSLSRLSVPAPSERLHSGSTISRSLSFLSLRVGGRIFAISSRLRIMNDRVSKFHLLQSNACLNLIQGSQSNFSTNRDK
jgi:hypothetical protein